KSDGLSGDIIKSLFEDREGSIWVATSGGLDRFRELPVTTRSVKQSLSSDRTFSVIAATDGSIWIATHQGLTRWKNGQSTIFRKTSGLPDDETQSLFQDDRGRVWVFTGHGLAYFKDGQVRASYTAADGLGKGHVPGLRLDRDGSLWVGTEEGGLSRIKNGRI